jgi:Macrocin-O-methyltransferase (TylF)
MATVKSPARNAHNAIVLTAQSEEEAFAGLAAGLKDTRVPDSELLGNLGLFMPSKHLARLLFFRDIYAHVVNTHGIVVEFGVRWGATLALLSNLRSIYEPFNRHRRIVGFDTFDGFKGVAAEDGAGAGKRFKDGDFSVSASYDEELARLLTLHEKTNPMSHVKRFELVKGDAVQTVPAWFDAHPEAVVSLAIFDFDIYAPTKAALLAVKPRLFKGSVLVFDELSDDVFPGETVAVQEVLGLNNLRIQRSPFVSRVCYAVVE